MFWRKWFRPTKTEIESPYGVLTATKSELGKANEQVRKLSREEDAERDLYVKSAQELASRYGIEAAELDADDLDELLKRWSPDVSTDDDFDVVAKTIGFPFGDHLVRRYSMRWIVLADEHGVDFAVREETTSCTSFPLAVVAKRLESGERDFLGPVAFAVQREIQQLRTS